MQTPVPSPSSPPPLPAEDVLVMRRFLTEACHGTPEVRALYAEMMSRLRRACFADIAEPPSAAAVRIVDTLKADGMADLGVLVDAQRCAEMRDYFRSRPVYGGHVVGHSDGVPRSLEETRGISHYGCIGRADVVRCPHVVEIANDPLLLQVAEAYLGCPPTIYSIHAWWSFAQAGTAALYSQRLHRDLDELRFVTLFVYLTPVGETNGAHRYIKHSHDKANLGRTLLARGWSQADVDALAPLFVGHGYDRSDVADALLGPLATVWTGPAGSAMIADTYGLHMGTPLTEGDRLMLWVRYGLGMLPQPDFGGGPGSYAPEFRRRIPATPRAAYVNRLLLTE